MASKETDLLFNRLDGLLDQALAAVRKGDGDAADLLLREAVTTANKMPKKSDATGTIAASKPQK